MKNKKLNTSFLGTGWNFPPYFERGDNSVRMITEEEDIRQSLEILLGTSCGERFLRPDFGCNLRDYLFEPLDTGLKTYIEDLINVAILYYEPRIKFLSIEVTPVLADNLLEINIHYIIKSTNTRSNYVYPFYLNEGTELK